jgi:predicted DNA-binding ribbon-helix-helix protein
MRTRAVVLILPENVRTSRIFRGKNQKILQIISFAGKLQGMRKVIPAILLCLMLSVATATERVGGEKAEKWNQVELWRHNLRTGMTDADVFTVLGQPKDSEVIRRIMTWYFQEPIERIDAKVTNRPQCGIVRFRSIRLRGSRRPVFQVIDWKEPDWEQLKRIAEAKAVEIAAAEAAKVQAERLKAEQERKAAELKQAELAKQRARQQIEQDKARARQKEAEAAKSSIVDRLIMKVKEPDKDTFIYGGIGLVVLVVFVFILAKKPW